MANWFLNKGTLTEPSRSELFLSLTNSTPTEPHCHHRQSIQQQSVHRTRFMLGASAEAVISFTYHAHHRRPETKQCKRLGNYGGKTVYKFQPSNALTLDSTGAIPRWTKQYTQKYKTTKKNSNILQHVSALSSEIFF